MSRSAAAPGMHRRLEDNQSLNFSLPGMALRHKKGKVSAVLAFP